MKKLEELIDFLNSISATIEDSHRLSSKVSKSHCRLFEKLPKVDEKDKKTAADASIDLQSSSSRKKSSAEDASIDLQSSSSRKKSSAEDASIDLQSSSSKNDPSNYPPTISSIDSKINHIIIKLNNNHAQVIPQNMHLHIIQLLHKIEYKLENIKNEDYDFPFKSIICDSLEAVKASLLIHNEIIIDNLVMHSKQLAFLYTIDIDKEFQTKEEFHQYIREHLNFLLEEPNYENLKEFLGECFKLFIIAQSRNMNVQICSDLFEIFMECFSMFSKIFIEFFNKLSESEMIIATKIFSFKEQRKLLNIFLQNYAEPLTPAASLFIGNILKGFISENDELNDPQFIQLKFIEYNPSYDQIKEQKKKLECEEKIIYKNSSIWLGIINSNFYCYAISILQIFTLLPFAGPYLLNLIKAVNDSRKNTRGFKLLKELEFVLYRKMDSMTYRILWKYAYLVMKMENFQMELIF